MNFFIGLSVPKIYVPKSWRRWIYDRRKCVGKIQL